MIENHFAQQLKLKRSEAAFTQQELADKLHVSRKTISSWETGRNRPDIDSLTQLAAIYHISLDELTGNLDESATTTFDKTKYAKHPATIITIMIVVIFVERITQLSTSRGFLWVDFLFMFAIGLRLLVSRYGRRLINSQIPFLTGEVAFGVLAFISGWFNLSAMGAGLNITCYVIGLIVLIDAAIQIKRLVRVHR
ncbi:helix-turn-helix domain-containing protein [Lentilactobacillus kisonensis]|nr:helix-turn-helix transcriptional regulator [Lentilactobacillus kisonensis]KRL22026.1 DNA-binding helix-turn-helix protein [Lentilactobacillus kisonensis DSM 19906 = JCM 15041]